MPTTPSATMTKTMVVESAEKRMRKGMPRKDDAHCDVEMRESQVMEGVWHVTFVLA